MCNGIIARPATPPRQGVVDQAYSRFLATRELSRSPHRGGPQVCDLPTFSPEARTMMSMFGMMTAMMSGDFGALMTMLSGAMNGNNQGGAEHAMPTGHPGFGDTGRSRGPRCANHTQQAAPNTPKVAAGESRELKEGDSVRGAHGTQLTWGKGDNVDIKYKAKNGQEKTISIKDGMISFDGGKPQKLENTGQLLKLPNGDVIGIGNQTDSQGGKDMCRVVMADSADKIACDPPSATNIYDVEQLERKSSGREGGGISMNLTSGSFNTACGQFNFTSLNASIFLGHEVQYSDIQQQMRFNSTK